MERQPVLTQLFTHAHSSSQTADRGDDEDDHVKDQGGAVGAIGKKLIQLPYIRGVARWLSPAARPDGGLRNPLVSPSAKYVAILHQATVTILSKVDNFNDPIGICRGASRVEEFSHGVWLEDWEMVVVVSSQRSLHYLNISGQEVDSLILPNWKGNGQICGLFAFRSSSEKGYEVVVLTSDGMLHHTRKMDKYDAATISTVQWSVRKQHPQGVSGFHFHAGNSVVAFVGPSPARQANKSTGCFSVSLWKLSPDPQLLCSNLEVQQGGRGLQWSKQGLEKKPAVRVSPSARLVAVVDGSSTLHVLSKVSGNMEKVQLGNEGETSSMQPRLWELEKLEDLEWISEEVVMVARHDGAVNEVLLPSLLPLLDEVPPHFSSGCRLALGAKGQTFVLDHLPAVEEAELADKADVDKKAKQKRLRDWRLSSIVERSKEEMFRIKIKEGNYAAALQLAQKYGLDEDEVYKARWTMSDFGRLSLQENLAKLRDRKWVVRECLTKVCSTQEDMNALLVYGMHETEPYRHEERGSREEDTWWFRLNRLHLLQHKDRLGTFLGMHNGRYFTKEYAYFRSAGLQNIACEYAEGGRVGALDVLFKRHMYSLAPSVLTILDAIPETLPPHSYSKLLPEVMPPKAFLVRGENDWVESKKTVAKLNTGSHALVHLLGEVSLVESTENMVKLVQGLLWPSKSDILEWYKKRARTIDQVSGQLENSLSLLDWGQQKGVKGLDPLFEDVSDLIKVVLTSDKSDDAKLDIALDEWELLTEYEKFQMMLQGSQPDSIVERLKEQALPFLHRHHRHSISSASAHGYSPVLLSSILAKWLRDMAQQNKLELCAAVFEDASSDPNGVDLFENENEMVGVAVDCIYLCPALDQWPLMKNILSRFAHNLDSPVKDAGMVSFQDTPLRGRLRKGIVSRFRSSVTSKPPTDVEAESGTPRAGLTLGDPRLRQAEARVESGQLLALYQVGTPMSFLASCEKNVKGTKQLLRTLLSKFSCRQPARSDSEWMAMWRDLCTLQENAFPFLEKEYLLAELCRGLLQAGKFSLAKSYLTGPGSMSLRADKAEKLVLDTARDFFYSAPSLDSPAIEMARNCLALVPESKAVTAEENMIEALTIKLPMLGVTLLPLEFRQVRDSIDVIHMAISAQPDAYLNLPELMEVAALLGMDSSNDKANVEAAVAREAAAAGDFGLARDLCLGLVEKGHGAIWDLCAALARGPEMESIDLKARKGLLGFALAHCDEESVGEMLIAWKDADMLDECNNLGLPVATHTDREALLSSIMDGSQGSGSREGAGLLEEGHRALSTVTVSEESSWDLLKTEHRKLASFACHQVPWLLKTISSDKLGDDQFKEDLCQALARECSNPSSFAAGLIVYGLASYDLVWSDHLVVRLAQEALRSGSKFGDRVGCGYLMNVKDAHMGAEVLEQEMGRRKVYEESVQAMHMARLYAAVQDASLSSSLPQKRREILLSSLSSVSGSSREDSGSSRWTHRRVRTEEKLKQMGQARTLERMVPGADLGRFAAGDQEYISHTILELVGPCAKKTSLTDVLALADQYSVDRLQVLLRQLETLFQSEMATEDDIASLWQQHGQELLQRPESVLDALVPTIYSALDGVNKKRLYHYFQVIADCSSVQAGEYKGQKRSDYWRTVANECLETGKVAENLNFKHIAGLETVDCLRALQEILIHVNGSNVSQLAVMIDHLHGFAADGYFPTSEDVYMAFVGKMLGCTPVYGSESELAINKEVETVEILEDRYNTCCHHIDHLSAGDVLRVVESILQKSSSICESADKEDSQVALPILLKLWTKIFEDAENSLKTRQLDYDWQNIGEHVKVIHTCCKVLIQLLNQKRVSEKQGWTTVNGVLHSGAVIRSAVAHLKFLRFMVSAGCSLRAVLAVVDSLLAENSQLLGGKERHGEHMDGNTFIEENQWESSVGPCGRESESHATEVTSTSKEYQVDLLGIYLLIVESALMDTDSNGRYSLVAVLTSLSNHGELADFEESDGHGLNLQHEIRKHVWLRLSEFAHDLQVPARTRISVLELQEAFRLGQLEGVDGFFITWGDWDSGSKERMGVAGGHEVFQSQSSLAALKSTEVVSPLWRGRQVTNEDLATLDAATTLFTNLLADSSTQEHVLALQSLLKEWDTVFEAETIKKKAEDSEGWADSEWGEGWEECNDDSASVNALHSCWASTLQRLVAGGCIKEALQALDGALVHPSTPLLTQEEAEDLVSTVGACNAVSALKLSLLLPYSPPQATALSLVEENIKQHLHMDPKEPSEGGVSEETVGFRNSPASSVDEELIGLLLAAGLLPTVARDAQLARLFNAVCKALGPLAWRLQEHQLGMLRGSKTNEIDNALHLIAFPLFVAELAQARLYPVAGALVLQFMRVPPALIVWNAAYVALKQYLEVLCESETISQSPIDEIYNSYLPNTMQHLVSRLKEKPRAGLSVLVKDMRPV